MRPRAFLPAALLGLLLVVAGLVFGLTPVHADGVSCGSPLASSTAAASAADSVNSYLNGWNSYAGGSTSAVTDCQSATSGKRPVALALLIPGALLVIGCGLGALYTESASRTAEQSPGR